MKKRWLKRDRTQNPVAATSHFAFSRRAVVAGLATAPFTHFAKADEIESFRTIPKSMWVWNTRPEQFGELHSFAKHWQVSQVLLSASTDLLDRLEARDPVSVGGITALRNNAIAVRALAGDPAWVMRQDLPPLIERLANHVPTLFDGIDLDVEPNALDEWHKGQREKLIIGLATFIDHMRAKLGRVSLGAALNPVYARIPREGGDANAMAMLAKKLDSVNLMAYRDRANALVKWAAPAATVLANVGLPWRSGVLVHESKEKGTSFFGASRPDFISQMTDLHRMLSGRFAGSYRGLIFEDYNGLRTILCG
jgi:hypothetical protein